MPSAFPRGSSWAFGKAEAKVVKLLEMIRDREGHGQDLLAEGTKRVASAHHRMPMRGTDNPSVGHAHQKAWNWPGYDARGLKTFALGLAAGRAHAAPVTTGRRPTIRISSGEVDRFSASTTPGAPLAKDTEEYAAVYDTLAPVQIYPADVLPARPTAPDRLAEPSLTG